MSKLPWQDIYKKFRQTHPNLSKMSVGFAPYGYAEILVYLEDGSKLSYNYDTQYVGFNAVPHSVPVRTQTSHALL